MPDTEETPTGFYDTRVTEELRPDGSSIWTAMHPALVGCTATGKSTMEALTRLDEARDLWIATAQELGRSIPASKDARAVLVRYAPRVHEAESTTGPEEAVVADVRVKNAA